MLDDKTPRERDHLLERLRTFLVRIESQDLTAEEQKRGARALINDLAGKRVIR